LIRNRLMPNGRATFLGLQGRRTPLRLSVESIEECNVPDFLIFLKALLKVAYENPALAPDNPHSVSSTLLKASGDSRLKEFRVVLTSCNVPKERRSNSSFIFFVEVRYNTVQYKPSGVPISGTYECSTRRMVQKLFG
jgi:hypothetical protein